MKMESRPHQNRWAREERNWPCRQLNVADRRAFSEKTGGAGHLVDNESIVEVGGPEPSPAGLSHGRDGFQVVPDRV